MIYCFIVDFFSFFVCGISNTLILIIYSFFMFYSMVDKFMTQWPVAEVFSILAITRSCGNIHCYYQHYQTDKITLHFSVLMIKYLVAMSFELWMVHTCYILWL